MAGALPFDAGTDKNDKEKLYIHSLFIHSELLSVIRKAASFDSAKRYQSFEDFSKNIRSFMDAYQNGLDEMVPVYLSINHSKHHLFSSTVPPSFQNDYPTDLS